VIVNVTDIAKTFDTQEFIINVTNANDDPLITSTAVTSAVEDEIYEYQVIAIDDDFLNPSNERLTFSLATAPVGMTIDSDSGLIQWLPTNDDVGAHWVNVTVSDLALANNYQNFTLTVLNINDAPEVNNTILDFSFYEDNLNYNIKINDWFKDIDGDSLYYNYEENENISISILDNKTVELKPRENWVGFETLIFYANDSIAQISDKVKVTILPVNDAPTNAIIMLAEIIYFEDKNQPAIGNASDVDIQYGDELTFSWYSNKTGQIGIGQEINLSLTSGTHTITLHVTDKNGEWVEVSIELEIRKSDDRINDKKDSDNDKYPDDIDAFPNNASEWYLLNLMSKKD